MKNFLDLNLNDNNQLKNLYYFGVGMFLCFLLINSLVGQTFGKKYRLLVVSSESMSPSLPESSLIIIKNSGQYFKNDIVTYNQDDTSTTITHRIIDQKTINQKNYFLTKGDSNPAADGWIAESRIKGKVIWSGLRLLGVLILLSTYDFWSQLMIIWLPVLVIILLEGKKIYLEIQQHYAG